MAICPDDNDMACNIYRLLPDNEVMPAVEVLPGCDRCWEEERLPRRLLLGYKVRVIIFNKM